MYCENYSNVRKIIFKQTNVVDNLTELGAAVIKNKNESTKNELIKYLIINNY